MSRLIRTIQTRFITHTGETIVLGVRLNHLIWTKYFEAAWAVTPMHEKISWILFVSNTIAILTLVQILAFK